MTGTAELDRRTKLRTRGLLMSCVALSVALPAMQASATALVLRSSGPSSTSYKPGRALPDNAKVALQPGDVVTILATDSTKTFHGPGNFALTGGGREDMPSVLAGRRGRFSALRTAGIVPRSPTLWHVDVSQNGKFCLADPNNVMLWRSSASRPATLTVTGPGGEAQTEQWPAGQTTVGWPQHMPISAGADYQLKLSDAGAPVHLKFATLPVMPTDIASVAKALIDEKCQNQLDLLIETVPEAKQTG